MVIAGILIAIAAVLAVPLEVAFRVERVAPLDGGIAVRWLFGLVRIGVPLGGRGERGGPERPPVVPERARPRRRVRPRGIVAALRDGRFRGRVRRLAGQLLRALHLDGLVLHARVGLGDPADTGRLWAVVGPLGAWAQGLPGADVRIEPEFLEPVLELAARGRIRVIPLRVLAVAVAFALSPASLRAWRTMRSADA